MKSKASLALMEQLIMVLVFALAAALCLRTFFRADQIAQETARRDEAVVLAQNAAQSLKAGLSPEEVEALLGSQDYRLEILEEPAAVPGLAQATVWVYYEDAQLFSLCTGWQEVAP